MSGTGVYYTTDQLTAMDAALTQAQAAFSAGDAQGVIAAVDSYYQVQIFNPTDGTVMRGYAGLAEATADDTGIGIVPNQEVATAIGQPNYTPLFQAGLALQLALADQSVIRAQQGQVPTLADVATYHAEVFQALGIPLTAWGGTAFVALGQDFTLGTATSAEQSAITTSLFDSLSANDVSASLWDLFSAGELSAGSLSISQDMSGLAALVGLDELAKSRFGSAYQPGLFQINLNDDGSYQVADAQIGVYQNVTATDDINYAITTDSASDDSTESAFAVANVDGTTTSFDVNGAPVVNLNSPGEVITFDVGMGATIIGSEDAIYAGPTEPGSVDSNGQTLALSLQGSQNLIYGGALDLSLDIQGYVNDFVGGQGTTSVEVNGDNSAANFMIGGSGTLNVNSTEPATWVIGGTGTVNYVQDGPSITLIGGSGPVNAQIVSDGASIATGSGVSNINLEGGGGQVVTGSGTSNITYVGEGGSFYQGDPSGNASFNLTGVGVSVAGGNDVTVTGAGDEILPWGPVPDYIHFPIGGNTDPTIAAAISATGAPVNLDGSIPTFQGGPPTGDRTITLNSNESSVYTGDQTSSVTVNGSNDTLDGGAGNDTFNIDSGTSNWIIASAGNNSYFDSVGDNLLDYTDSPAPVYVNLDDGFATNGFGGTDTLGGITWVDAGGGSTLVAGNVNTRLEIDGDGGSLYAGEGSDSLTGNGDGINFYLGTGTTQVSANGADDDYVFSAGQSGGGTAAITQSTLGVTGTLQFLSGASPGDIWFSQDGSNNLVATQLGTGNAVTVDGWFDASGASGQQLSDILANGASIDNASISRLEGAMSSYQADNPSFDPSTATSMPSDPNLDSAISTYWQTQ